MADLIDRRRDNSILSSFKLKLIAHRAPTPSQTDDDDSEIDGDSSMDYQFEQTRLESFENWPSPYVSPAELVAAGFYYTGETDKVRCFECKMEICRWEEGDDPMVEHQRWTNRCRFICNRLCGNIPIKASEPSGGIHATPMLRTITNVKSQNESMPFPSVNSISSVSATEDQQPEQPPAKMVREDLGVCKICYIEKLGVVFMPCGHMTCMKCAPGIITCAKCRSPITMTIRAFLS